MMISTKLRAEIEAKLTELFVGPTTPSGIIRAACKELRIDPERVTHAGNAGYLTVSVRGRLTMEARDALCSFLSARLPLSLDFQVVEESVPDRQAAHDAAVYRAKRRWK